MYITLHGAMYMYIDIYMVLMDITIPGSLAWNDIRYSSCTIGSVLVI